MTHRRQIYLEEKRKFLIGKKCIIYPNYDATEGINLSGKINLDPDEFENCRPTCRKGTIWIFKNKDQALMLGIVSNFE